MINSNVSNSDIYVNLNSGKISMRDARDRSSQKIEAHGFLHFLSFTGRFAPLWIVRSHIPDSSIISTRILAEYTGRFIHGNQLGMGVALRLAVEANAGHHIPFSRRGDSR
jgi:hypothetical protein